MHEPEDDEDPFGPALDKLQAAGLTPRPIVGYRAGDLDGIDGVGILQHKDAVSAADRERIDRVMSDLSYVFEEVAMDLDGTMRRVADGRFLGGVIYRKPDGTLHRP